MAILSENIPFAVWAAAVSSVALVVATLLTRHIKAKGQIGVVVGIALLAAGSLIGPPLLAAIAGSPDRPDAAAAEHTEAERHALERRRAELSAVALAPGSPLACLNALAGMPVETACERSVFASPASTAVAVAYAAGQLGLLADGAAFARRRAEPSYLARLAELRLAAENDAYGIYAHVLATRDGCTPERCDAFVLVHNPSILKLHLRQRLYATVIARHRGRWRAENEASGSVQLMAAPVSPPSTAGTTAESGRPTAQSEFAGATPLPRERPVVTAQSEPPAAAARPVPSLWFASAAVSVASVGAAGPMHDAAVDGTATADATSTITEKSPDTPAPAERSLAAAPEELKRPVVAAAIDKPPVTVHAQQAQARGVVPLAESVLTDLQYPSAASIPPISIMAEEPELPAEPVSSTAPVPPARPQ